MARDYLLDFRCGSVAYFNCESVEDLVEWVCLGIYIYVLVYGRNQSGCEKSKNVGFLLFIHWAFLTIYIFVALMKITMCFYQLEASHFMSWDS